MAWPPDVFSAISRVALSPSSKRTVTFTVVPVAVADQSP